jgi:excisionase family DNA binding protein
MEINNSIMTVDELAKELRISRVKAYELVHQKDFPSIKIGRSIRISREAFNRWISSNS